jgi:E3 ubiquitin-protein ligase HECTD2
MFLYDDDSGFCYFNPASFETSDQYYLVGALLGLAIYNSTILDVALPPFAFRKLLASAPASTQTPAPPSASRSQVTYTLEDLAEWRPALAKGLRDLLEFDGDVEETYCRDFVASVDRYGAVVDTPLKPNGDSIPVTNENRREYVDAYVRHVLDTSVARQFEPFKRGFFTVCAGNALSLFRAEEIELMVRGSDEALDVDSLKAVAVYENWREVSPPNKLLASPAEQVPVISWFWDCFRSATPQAQRKLLGFITASDRIPAVGSANLVLRIVCGGDGLAGQVQQGQEIDGSAAAAAAACINKDAERFPIARTCFNMLVLWGYESREKLEEKLWRAVAESEGFGLK